MIKKLDKLDNNLRGLANPSQAAVLQRFFKTSKGEYGEGDVFLGIKVPVLRGVANEFGDLSLSEIQLLLNSKVHEKRMVALFVLIDQFKKGSDADKERFFEFYLRNAKRVNNWDLVDLSAPNIVGSFLLDKDMKDRTVLYKLAKSNNLWERRIAIVSTFAFIRNNEFKDTLRISKLLLSDSADLIHKSVGWMLREVGKRDVVVLEKFLKPRYKQMPRTMLRYAIEKFDVGKRKRYLEGLV